MPEAQPLAADMVERLTAGERRELIEKLRLWASRAGNSRQPASKQIPSWAREYLRDAADELEAAEASLAQALGALEPFASFGGVVANYYAFVGREPPTGGEDRSPSPADFTLAASVYQKLKGPGHD